MCYFVTSRPCGGFGKREVSKCGQKEKQKKTALKEFVLLFFKNQRVYFEINTLFISNNSFGERTYGTVWKFESTHLGVVGTLTHLSPKIKHTILFFSGKTASVPTEDFEEMRGGLTVSD